MWEAYDDFWWCRIFYNIYVTYLSYIHLIRASCLDPSEICFGSQQWEKQMEELIKLARQVARQVCRTIQGEDFWAKKWREMFESFANMPWLFLMFESLTFSINCICAQKCQAVWFLDLSHWAMLNGVWCMACLYIFGETQRCTTKAWLIRTGKCFASKV